MEDGLRMERLRSPRESLESLWQVGREQVEVRKPKCLGNLTSALSGWWCLLWAGSGCGGSGRAPGWCGWAVLSLLWRCCGGAVCWLPVISLLTQSVVVGEVG